MELMHSKNQTQNNSGASTQKYVNVEEIKNDLIVLKNKSLRAVFLVSSINFELKSSDEQEAIIAGYQNFINSLDFPIQIMISSKKLDINPYLQILEEKRKTQTNELLRLQISEYSNFIKELTEISQIMTKRFYLVVPFYPVENLENGFLDRVMNFFNPKQQVEESVEIFETYKNQLWQRVDQISSGLTSLGIKATVLNTEELVELLYSSYNPSIYSSSTIKDVELMDFE
ncbi:MAG: hypothetical protein UR60_C0012G0005 [Candidatus Moranbacteria bacterium GW2011_GWF2_34_56]|nr:MAG: hypothetical protein UR51_C0013G0011 [Candidatus Moranbacteria bacterium GW2011_GWF1_34_10]KKP64915.1 MAG: hypothetical protein UR60_C0012G0005 [Candidatus Moranbacteria bacterium GW2011_GWF2_34_56]HBI17295.1 hypothetical protein [Candidatus Moranbacteria bacterium]